jgi:hypothetical protein
VIAFYIQGGKWSVVNRPSYSGGPLPKVYITVRIPGSSHAHILLSGVHVHDAGDASLPPKGEQSYSTTVQSTKYTEIVV